MTSFILDVICSGNQTWNRVIGSPGQLVIWVIFYVRVTESPGHHFDPVWDPSFFSSFRKKCPKCKTYIWNAEMTTKVICQVSVVGLKSLDVSPCNELLLLPMIIINSLAWEYFFTHKSTFGVYYTPWVKKTRHQTLGHNFTNHYTIFKIFFRSQLGSKFATNSCLNIPPRFKHVATLSCEIWMQKNGIILK